MVSERLRALRERLQRRETATRAKRQAKARRIEKGEPEGVSEAAQVRVRQAKAETQMTAQEARALAADARTLVATELGVPTSEADSIIKRGAGTIREFSDRLEAVDFDGDGDTDILSALDVEAVERDDGEAFGESTGGLPPDPGFRR